MGQRKMNAEEDRSYLAWAKRHVGRLPLCLRCSGMRPRPLAPLMAAALQCDGPAASGATWHHESIAQLIAERWGCSPDHVQPTMGTSGANFLVLATLLGGGGELLCERPCYDPLWHIDRQPKGTSGSRSPEAVFRGFLTCPPFWGTTE